MEPTPPPSSTSPAPEQSLSATASSSKLDQAPPSAAELDAFQAQATLSMSLLFNQMSKFVTGYKPKTAEELSRESAGSVPV